MRQWWRRWRQSPPSDAASRALSSELPPFDLDQPLLSLSPQDVFTIRDACEGVHIFGSIGSGKTSGSGAVLARAYLASGFGGLVLCSKPEERRLWEGYAHETGRSASLVIVEPGKNGQIPPWRFNFLDYEIRRGDGGGQTENLITLLTRVVELVEGKRSQAGGEPFWMRAAQEMMRNAVDLLSVAQGTVTLLDIFRLITDAPKTAPAFMLPPSLQMPADDPLLEDQRQAAIQTFYAQREQNFCWQLLNLAEAREKNPQQTHDFNMATRYWLHHFPEMDSRTRSGVIATFTSAADLLSHGLLHQLLGTDTNLVPEAAYKDGAVIILDISIQQYQEVGRILQGIWKLMFQRAVLRRDAVQHPRPVFLWADEAQNFVSSYDFEYQAVARSARACTVYLSQNISNYYSVLGAQGRDETHALLGNFQTKIFHANADHATNQFAADSIAQAWTVAYNFNSSMQSGQAQGGQPSQTGGGGSQVMQYKVLPAAFTTLRKGGPQNGLIVEGIVFQGGRIWRATGDTYLKAMFKQQ